MGPVVERVLYSLKLKVVPNLNLNHQQPLSKLLPVTRHHLILSYKFRIDKREYQQ